MDVIALHQAGFSQAVASLGTALTTQQAISHETHTPIEVLVNLRQTTRPEPRRLSGRSRF